MTGAAVGRGRPIDALGLEDVVTLLDCLPRRGRAAMDDLGVIGQVPGAAVHAGLKPYRHDAVDHALAKPAICVD